MPFCTQCGARLENGAKYCTSCGAKQPEPSATVYVPPTEERPAEPRTYSYTPPASAGAGQPGGYTYDPTIYSANDGAANKARGKKGGTVVFLILAALVVIAALIFIFLSVKGGTSVSDDSVLGLYSAQKAESSGFSISIESMWKDGFTIELKEKGKAEINVDGQKGSAKWTLDGNAFSIKGSGIDCAGTLSNGVLTLENVMGTEITLYFSKDGTLIPSAEWEAPHPVPGTDPVPDSEPAPGTTEADGELPGLYTAVKAEAYGVEIEISAMWEKGFSIELKENGNCDLSVNGNSAPGKWTQNGTDISVEIPGLKMDGTFSDGVLTFEDLYGMGVTLFFVKDGAVLPAAEADQAPPLQAETDLTWWDGNWYGWWTACDGGGEFEDVYGSAWDACAAISAFSDGTGKITVWDQDGRTVVDGTVSFAEGMTPNGSMSASDVLFLNTKLDDDRWTADPGDPDCGAFPQLFCITGRYTDPENAENWFEYQIYLRPWGTRWEDVRDGDTSGMVYPDDMLPLNYTNWYLPLIEADQAMPGGFEGLE